MRRTETVVVPDDEGFGRDAKKHFQIKEVPALQAEKWFWRLVIALKGTSAQIPENIASYGMAGIAIITARAINAFFASDVDWQKLEPLMDELMTCVKIIRNPSANDRATGVPLATDLKGQDDIEEIKTIVWLRSEVLRVHTNFSFTEGLLNLVSMISKPQTDSSTTSTSPPSSGTQSAETPPS
jgi:hypothetical protein